MPKIVWLVQKNRQGQIKYIKLTLEGKRITRTWGIKGGKEREPIFHDYVALNVGKANEVSPAGAALADLIRIMDKKKKEGYLVAEDLDNLPLLLDVDPLDNLDYDDINTGFCISKPIQTVTIKKLDELINSGSARFFVKYNGGCHFFVVNGSGEVRIYTRRWDDHTSKYPLLVQSITDHCFPPETIGAMEVCVDPLLNREHMWCFKQFAEISKTGTVNGKCKPDQSEAHELQKKNPIKGAVFALLYLGGEQIHHWPYAEVLEQVELYVKPLSANNTLFAPQEVKAPSGESLLSLAVTLKKAIEGFVAWDVNQALEITMNGKPLRRAAWKVKARGEMDVIAWGGEFGKKAGLYGSLKICRLDAEGTAVDMGTVGGLKHKQGEADPSYWTFPCVIEIGYDNIFPDTGLPQFGNFSKIHEDKTIEEVALFSLNQR